MANLKHVEVLTDSADAWNAWRTANPMEIPDLTSANLSGTDLRDRNLFRANCGFADLRSANFAGSNLGWADFTGADLRNASLARCFVTGTDFHRATFGATILATMDLSAALGLETSQHARSSSIGADTLQLTASGFGHRPKGDLIHRGQRSRGLCSPYEDVIGFLAAAGVAPSLMSAFKGLIHEETGYASCFISYSSRDHRFAARLFSDLIDAGVRCWWAPEDMQGGQKILDSLFNAIHASERVLLILSADSVSSNWVEDEVMLVFEEERQRKALVLFPIRIDDTVMTARKAWMEILHNRHIVDFHDWEDPSAYSNAISRVLRDLKR